MTPPRSDVEVLRECPFCGGRAKTKLPYVRCVECGAQMCYGDDPTDPASAIAAWNRRAAIEVMEGKGWRPIESAPKDGRVVLVGRHVEPWGFVYGAAHFRGKPGALVSGWISRGLVDPPGELGLAEPSHWMPLPTPPQPNEEKGK